MTLAKKNIMNAKSADEKKFLTVKKAATVQQMYKHAS